VNFLDILNSGGNKFSAKEKKTNSRSFRELRLNSVFALLLMEIQKTYIEILGWKMDIICKGETDL